MTTSGERALVDRAAGLLCLGAGFHAVEAVDPDGERWYWILDSQYDGDELIRIPDHERVGPLPPLFRQRLARPLQPRCGRPRKDGQPCGTYVPRAGAACHHHRTRTPS